MSDQFPGLRDVHLYETDRPGHPRPFSCAYTPEAINDGSLGTGPALQSANFDSAEARIYYLRAEGFRVRLTQTLIDSEYWEKAAKTALARLRHAGDPSDCAILCANCEHRCSDHDMDSDNSCNHDDMLLLALDRTGDREMNENKNNAVERRPHAKTFREVIYNWDDQVTVRNLIMELTPPEVQEEIIRRFNADIDRWNTFAVDYPAVPSEYTWEQLPILTQQLHSGGFRAWLDTGHPKALCIYGPSAQEAAKYALEALQAGILKIKRIDPK